MASKGGFGKRMPKIVVLRDGVHVDQASRNRAGSPPDLQNKRFVDRKSWDPKNVQGFPEIISRNTSAETSVAAVTDEPLSGGRRPNHASPSDLDLGLW